MTEGLVDLVALRAMVQNPHAYPIVMLTEGLEFCIEELENARTTLDMDLVYIRKLEEEIEYRKETP